MWLRASRTAGALVSPDPRDVPPVIRVYRVEHMVTPWGTERYVCPICGELSGAVLKGHGQEHVIPDASQ